MSATLSREDRPALTDPTRHRRRRIGFTVDRCLRLALAGKELIPDEPEVLLRGGTYDHHGPAFSRSGHAKVPQLVRTNSCPTPAADNRLGPIERVRPGRGIVRAPFVPRPLRGFLGVYPVSGPPGKLKP